MTQPLSNEQVSFGQKDFKTRAFSNSKMNSRTTSAGNQFSVKAEHTHLDKWFCYWRVHHGNENQCQWLCIPSKHMPETHKIDKVRTSKSILPAVETRKSK